MKFLSNAVWEALHEELISNRERIDRLTEALARKFDTQLILPQPVRTPQNIVTYAQVALEPSEGYFDVRKPSPSRKEAKK